MYFNPVVIEKRSRFCLLIAQDLDIKEKEPARKVIDKERIQQI